MKSALPSRKRSRFEHNPARAHSIVCRRFTEIETIYPSYQDLLCNPDVIPSKPERAQATEGLALSS